MADRDPLLSVKDLSVVYNGILHDVNAVKKISFDLYPGEALAIVGESGSGKTTAAFALMGMLAQKHATVEGRIMLKNRDILKNSKRQWQDLRGKEIAMIFQDPMTSLNPYLKIGHQISEPIRRHNGADKKTALDKAVDLLETMELPNPRAMCNAYPHQFSGGMRQRAMIASAFSASPGILVADEPTTALDVITQARVLKLIRQYLQEHEMSLILITHDLGIVAGLCQRVIVMKDGEIVESGSALDVYGDPKHEYTRNLLKAVPRIDGETRIFASKQVAPDEPPTASEPLIRVDQAAVHFTTGNSMFKEGTIVRAVDNVSLDLFRGEILGLVGQSGSGKSTLIRAIAGLQPLTAGRIDVEGMTVDTRNRGALKNMRRRLQMIFQDPLASLNGRFTVERIIGEPLVNYGIMKGKKACERARELMEMVSLDPDWANRFPHEFSGGQCQRIGIARALALEPDILLCDEPVSALDVSIQAEILTLLVRLRDELGLTMLFISHDLAVVRHLADRVAVMQEGKIVELKPAETIYTESEHIYTQTLLKAVPIPDPSANWL